MRTRKHRNGAARNAEAGFTLIEMLIAAMVLLIGMTAGMLMITLAMANDNRSKNDSSATILSQMTLEMIATVPANATTSVSIVDCNPTTSSASHTVNTGAGGATLSSGLIDFTQATVSGYSMTYYACQASTGDRQQTYDVRWNIKTLSSNAKLVTVAAKPIGGNTGANFLAAPVSLRMIVGI